MNKSLKAQDYVQILFNNKEKMTSEIEVLKKIYSKGDNYVSMLDIESSPYLRTRAFDICQTLKEQGVLEGTKIPVAGFDAAWSGYKVSEDVQHIIAKYVRKKDLK